MKQTKVLTCHPVWYRVVVFAQEVLVIALGVVFSKQPACLFIQNRLDCIGQVLAAGH